MGEESSVERAFRTYLGGLPGRAEALRTEARETLERGVRQAAAMGWSQRRIAEALGRSQPEVKRLLDPEAEDIKSASACGDAIVYDRFGTLHLFGLKAGTSRPVPVKVAATSL